MDLAPKIVHHSDKHLWEPEIGSREDAEDGGHTHKQMEVADDKIGIVHIENNRGLSEEDTAETTGREERHKTDSKKHCSGEMALPSPHSSDPVESFDRRRHSDRKSQKREGNTGV